MVSTQAILENASRYDFSKVRAWLEHSPHEVSKTDAQGWTVLHWVAEAEAKGIAIDGLVEALLAAGADPHQSDHASETPFNIAAPSSPKTGRLMTNHWLESALVGKGPKGLNDTSGSHDSTLAQYIGKWSADDEIADQLRRAKAVGMKIAVQNSSGWTALHAAAAMGRANAVKAFASLYTEEEKNLRTTEEYIASYGVNFPAHATAAQTAQARLDQDNNLTAEMKAGLQKSIAAIRN